MPACTSESLSKLWNPSYDASRSSAHYDSAPSTSPSSPMSASPPSGSPICNMRTTKVLRRTLSSSSSSNSTIVNEPFVIQSDRRTSMASQTSIRVPDATPGDETNSFLVRIVGWYPLFLLRIIRVLLVTVSEITVGKVLFALPSFWLSIWLWVFWKVIQLPLMTIKWMITLIHTPISEQFRKKRTVLISGGSTIQALHLARNFYSAGVRVIVIEVDGLFSFTRFSTAVNKFYNVPKPTSENPQAYVKALCQIVERENIAFYVPVCSTTSACYDAIAKPHLELLGCKCFCPEIAEVNVLDDCLEIMRKCENNGIQTPSYYHVISKEEIFRLYDAGTFRAGHFVMYTAGPVGIRNRAKYEIPTARSEFKLQHEVSEQRPWVIMQNIPGDNFLTCTTVKASQVIANVTCHVDKNNNGLVPVEHREIAQWLTNFFANLRSLRPISGHISFRFVVADISGCILPLGSRVGVSLPYICHTKVHPRVLWKPCKHFSRQNSGPLVAESGSYWMPETVLNTLRHPSVASVGRFINTVLDKREALFVFWDPLPYCAYYHMQLPFRNIIGFVQRRRRNHVFNRTLAAPVH